jgi:hypothetical protein
MKMARHIFLFFVSSISLTLAFHTRARSVRPNYLPLHASSNDDDSLTSLVTARLPTSVDDQVRLCAQSIQRASSPGNDDDRIVRQNVRLLLPVIGATDLDDWPGGARQMMVAAVPLVESIMAALGITDAIQKVCLDENDGVYAWLGQAEEAKDDCAFVLLPAVDSLGYLKQLEEQVGPKRNLVLVNPQWRRRSDFGGVFGVDQIGVFGADETSASYVEAFQPTFSLTNFICEGESVRVLHAYGSGVWRVYVRKDRDNGDVDWDQVGEKPYSVDKPENWIDLPGNSRDGGQLFDYGQPSYQEIIGMFASSPNYTPKNPAERAAAAFALIKDTL